MVLYWVYEDSELGAHTRGPLDLLCKHRSPQFPIESRYYLDPKSI